MDRKLADEIYSYLVECGQNDHEKFKLGEIIKYTPSEIQDLLYQMPTHAEKPPLGVYPYWIVYEDRIKDLAGGIIRYSDRLTDRTDAIRLWAKEIEELCDVTDYLSV